MNCNEKHNTKFSMNRYQKIFLLNNNNFDKSNTDLFYVCGVECNNKNIFKFELDSNNKNIFAEMGLLY